MCIRDSYCAERGLPVVYIPGTEFGLTSPATMAGTLAAGIADLLPAVVISQLVDKGAPIIAACFRNNVDFRTMKLNHSRPEMITANCTTAEVWRYMGLPFCCNMANTGNGDFGPLSAFEKAIQYYSVMLSGINMCYGLGCYEEGMLLRPSDLIFANEEMCIRDRDEFDMSQNGIKHRNIRDFLLMNEWN